MLIMYSQNVQQCDISTQWCSSNKSLFPTCFDGSVCISSLDHKSINWLDACCALQRNASLLLSWAYGNIFCILIGLNAPGKFILVSNFTKTQSLQILFYFYCQTGIYLDALNIYNKPTYDDWFLSSPIKYTY